MKTVAVICDCDNTLAPDTTSKLLEDNGIDLDSFWDDVSSNVKLGWDPPIAWMTEIANLIQGGKIAQDTNAKLAEFGRTVTPFHHAARRSWKTERHHGRGLRRLLRDRAFDEGDCAFKVVHGYLWQQFL